MTGPALGAGFGNRRERGVFSSGEGKEHAAAESVRPASRSSHLKLAGGEPVGRT